MVDSKSNETESNVQIQPEKNIVEESSSKKRVRDESFKITEEMSNKKARIEDSEIEETSTVNPVQKNGGLQEIKNSSITVKNDSESLNAPTETIEADSNKQNSKNQILVDKDNDKVNNENDLQEIKQENIIQQEKNQELDSEDSNKSKDPEKEIKNVKKNKDSEIINGMELTVECASDHESSEESDQENLTRKSKTIIVREQPNDSEVDVSSSEDEKSNSCKEMKSKSNLDSPAKSSKRKDKKVFSKSAILESENSSKSSSDDCPLAERKAKEFSNSKKSTSKSTGAKRGRGRPRGRPSKAAKKMQEVISDNESEEKNEINTKQGGIDDKECNIKSECLEDSKNKIKSNDDNSDSDVSDDEKSEKESNIKNVEKRKTSQRNIKKIEQLKKYIRAAGIRVKCYQTLLKDCKTDAAKARRLHEFLEENGIVGRPNLEKCKKLRLKNEGLKELEKLDSSNIISEHRTSRGRNTRKSQVESEVTSSPQLKSQSKLKKIQAIYDSDSE